MRDRKRDNKKLTFKIYTFLSVCAFAESCCSCKLFEKYTYLLSNKVIFKNIYLRLRDFFVHDLSKDIIAQ